MFLQAEQEYSRYNFEHANTEMLLAHFRDAERSAGRCLDKGGSRAFGRKPASKGNPRAIRAI